MSELDHLGPLAVLVGTWTGAKGQDESPEPDGTEENAYRETVTYSPIGDVDNAEEQELVGVHYHQIAHRIRDNKHLHDQCGYWMWDQANNTVIHSFAIPRGVAVVSEGSVTATEHGYIFELSSNFEQGHIAESAFMSSKAKTNGFRMTVEVSGATLKYEQHTELDIYGRSFDHQDHNTLTKQ